MISQFELSQSDAVFNLSVQSGIDPWRVERERAEAEQRSKQAAEYQRKMQLSLERCPGFSGCDAPALPGAQGMVVVEPGRIGEAWSWLKRRYHVCESLELSTDQGIAIRIAPRNRRVTGQRRKRTVRFGPATQYEFAFT